MQETSRVKTFNAIFSSSFKPKGRFTDANGFLHVHLRFMRTGILRYAPTQEMFPDGVPLGGVGDDGKVAVYVDPSQLQMKESLESLSGMPVLRSHDWATPQKDLDQIGSISGVPEFDGEFVHGEAVITDAEAIEAIERGELTEVSAAYAHELILESGEFEGEQYVGRQENLLYNHAVLLPRGGGRAGPMVGVMNSKENDVEKIMVWSRKLKKAVFAMNEDDAKAIAELDDAAAGDSGESDDGNDDIQPAPNPGAGGDTPPSEVAQIKNLDKLLDELAKVKARSAELEGQLQIAQEKINELLSPGTLEAEAESLATEREEVVEVMAENGIEKTVAMNSIKEGKLRGHDLRVFAMNSIREKQGKSKIEGDALKDESLVRGMWNATKDYAGAKKVVVGALAQNSTAMNGADDYIKQSRRNLGFDVK